MPRELRVVLLAAATALAFADSSIVVLGLPEILARFDAKIGNVAWVVTAYNLPVAALALALADTVRRLGPVRLAAGGLVAFLAGSVGCAAAGSLGVLIGLRVVQGAGAALLLAAALPALAAATGSRARGVRVWALASTVGVAVGPAAGGILTELFDWRAIFAAQAPVAVAALLALRGLPAVPPSPPPAAPTRALDRVHANASLALVSGGLVGVLFLAVVLLVDVWRRSPLAAALVVTALPLAALAAPPLLRGLREGVAIAGGAVLLAAGLVALAFVPGSGLGWVIAALVVAGLGFGAAVPALTGRALHHPRDIASAGAASVAARHVGLVIGLLVVSPLLAHTVTRSEGQATLRGVALVLDAPLPVTAKVPLALDLHHVLRTSPDGRIPNFAPAFAAAAARGGASPALAALQDGFTNATTAPVARAFRRPLLAAALLALLAVLPAVRLRRGWSPGSLARPGPLVLAAAGAGAVALVVVELARGGAGYGSFRLHDPCRPRVGDSFVLRGLDAAACRRGESREELLLSAADSPLGGIAAAVPDLKRTVEHWLEEALQARRGGGATALEKQAFEVLDQLFGR